MADFDIVILSNGPGEITTWVFPLLASLSAPFPQARISVILSPCPNSSGRELTMVQQCAGVHRALGADDFFPFLLWGKTPDDWHWCDKGMVIFLGGDQFFTLVIAKRLGYKSLVYAEWEGRWYRYLDHFAVMNEQVKQKIPAQFQHKCTVVGDLMLDVPSFDVTPKSTFRIGFLPGSKASKLTQGMPFVGALAHSLAQKNPSFELIIPIAPTINSEILYSYTQIENNSYAHLFGDFSYELISENNQEYLLIDNQYKVRLISKFPCYDELKQCDICVTTVGANTAQLASLGVPMIVLIPLFQLDAMKSWDGLLGLMANLPVIGSAFAKLINWFVVIYTHRTNRLYAWPNIWAKREIIPELMGYLKVEDIANLIIDYYNNPQKLEQIKQDLQPLQSQTNSSQKIVEIIEDLIST